MLKKQRDAGRILENKSDSVFRKQREAGKFLESKYDSALVLKKQRDATIPVE